MSKWLKEFARDLLALGSIPMYFLVVIRAVIGNDYGFVYQMLIAAIAVFILSFLIKGSSMHVAMAFAALVFVSLLNGVKGITVFFVSLEVLLESFLQFPLVQGGYALVFFNNVPLFYSYPRE